jgi:hypothetical protein
MVQGKLHGSQNAPGATGASGSAPGVVAGAAGPCGIAAWEVMPTPLRRFSLGRYEVSVRYVPAQSGGRVGGDWYDARLGVDGSATVAIGDVSGHGPVAAAGMVRIGNALRGLSFTGQPANTVLGWLNRVVCADEYPEQVASAVVCVLDQAGPGPRRGTARADEGGRRMPARERGGSDCRPAGPPRAAEHRRRHVPGGRPG